jgi:hypothetical protein
MINRAAELMYKLTGNRNINSGVYQIITTTLNQEREEVIEKAVSWLLDGNVEPSEESLRAALAAEGKAP